jgi:ABC-2 type transport system permease protein
MSALFTNQVAAYIGALVAIVLLWWLLGFIGGALQTEGTVFNFLNMSAHFDSFLSGLVNLSDLVYFLSVITLGLVAGSVFLESRRWRS